ncbi:MAG TPA: nucleotide disphospho-sugar-binding domain-containing protein [Bryobacteraceae bacterium]|jgi:MGT family glycosyltransferase
MHFGIISPPVSGHLHPFGALGRELISRGHRVTLFHMPDLADRAQEEGLEFVAVGESDHPRGSLPDSLRQLGKLHGLAALRFTIDAVRRTTEMLCREAPAAVRTASVDFLLVDQVEPAGGSVAEHIGIPFVTISNALLLNREPDVPPPFTGWSYQPGAWARIRNRLGYEASGLLTRPVTQVLRKARQQWKLPAHATPGDSISKLAQISQQPAAFDFPRRELPPSFHYVGPLRRAPLRKIPFPWEKLDGRPLVYASLGTLQNAREPIFRLFSEACADFPVQLVITHGGGLDDDAAASFPGNPLVVSYAPQMDVLARATLTLTHAGLNTVLDSLANGVPLVAIPLTYEQPAIARRVVWSGVGETIPFSDLDLPKLRNTIARVLSEPVYAEKARQMKTAIEQAGGAVKAADLIEGLAR